MFKFIGALPFIHASFHTSERKRIVWAQLGQKVKVLWAE